MNVKSVAALLHVSDMERSLRYYVDGLGFTIQHKWVVDGNLRWCGLAIGGAALMLQEFSTEGLNAWVASGKVGEGVALYFQCEDAIAIYREVTAREIVASEPVVGNWWCQIFCVNANFSFMEALPFKPREPAQCDPASGR